MSRALALEWVDQILVTAFDGQYGGCWYWVNEEDWIKHVRILTGEADTQRDDAEGPWTSVIFRVDPVAAADAGLPGLPVPNVQVDDASLAAGVDRVLKEFAHTETARQIRSARAYEDEQRLENGGRLHDTGPDLDAEAADVIVQVALFGTIVYS